MTVSLVSDDSLIHVTTAQISLMAAVPRHPFFRCALAMAVRNVHWRVHGRNTLDTTGPVLAGACLRKLHAHINYTMALFMAHERSRTSKWNKVPGVHSCTTTARARVECV